MATVYNYLFMTVGLIVLFTLAGFPTLSGSALQELGILNSTVEDISDFDSGGFFDQFDWGFGLLAGGAALGIAIGTILSRGNMRMMVFAVIAIGVITLFIADMQKIISLLSEGGASWVAYFGYAIMIPYIVGFVVVVINWIGGQET